MLEGRGKGLQHRFSNTAGQRNPTASTSPFSVIAVEEDRIIRFTAKELGQYLKAMDEALAGRVKLCRCDIHRLQY